MHRAARLVTTALAVLAAAQVAAAQSVQAAIGSQVNQGGSALAGSFGYSPLSRLTLLVNVERVHVPTEVEGYEHGWGATRGGTTTFVSGEAQVSLRPPDRITPYALAGLGRGVSRPNVSEIFPHRVTNEATLLFAGGGVRVPLGPRLSAFADARYVIQTERGELGVFLPIRGGVAWRF